MLDQYGLEKMRIDRITIEKVIVLHVTKGEGTQKDMVRPVAVYCDMDGKYLFEIDPINK